MKNLTFNAGGPNLIDGLYLIPTLKFWRNDLREINLGVTHGLSLFLFKWELGVWVNYRKKKLLI